VALVCASAATATALTQQLLDRGLTDGLVVTAPPAFETNPAFEADLIERLQAHATTHLFFGLGAPKSEIWMHAHRAELPDCYCFGFGAALDFQAGTKRRAPRWLRRAGLEFAWRVATEPRRLARRYFVNSWIFVRAIALDLSRRTPSP
jgi:N-acetylglucosaminyldiphosphoundecaprenol N-acetyl-beta-D-mannosaminyltransferase